MMKLLSIFEKLWGSFKHRKLYILLLSILVFSLIYMILDDKHFSGVNSVKDTIKKEVIKKKVESEVQNTHEITENFYLFENNELETEANVSKEIGKVAEQAKQEVKEEDLTVENLDISLSQNLFDRIYFAVNTSTLLGYGDIFPITNLSKSLVMCQSLLTVCLIVL